jgi:hypothetical protein
MQLKCLFAELDDATREYVIGVAKARGRGAPGVFFSKSSWSPWVAILAGGLLGPVLFCCGMGSGKAAWAVAAMQTAGVLLGGWLVLFAFRRWFAGVSDTYPGKFLYFDPLHVYQSEGEGIQITSLKTVQAVTAVPGDGGFKLAFDLGDDRVLWVPMPSAGAAAMVEDYYAAMADIEKMENSPFTQNPAMIGAAAVYAAREGELPRDTGDLQLESETIATEPEKSRKVGMGYGPLAILGVGSVLFVGFVLANATVGNALSDDLAFDAAKADGAPGLRVYLLDEAHTRHREEAKQLIAAAYDAPVQKLQAIPTGTAEAKAARAGFVGLLESLRTADQPAVSLSFRTKVGAIFTAEPTARQQIADGLARGVDPKLILFLVPPEGKPANIEIDFTPATGPQTLATYTFRFRPNLDAPPTVTQVVPASAVGFGQHENKVCEILVGGFTPAPPPPVEDF